MKIYIKILVISIMCLLTLSCSKDDDDSTNAPVYIKENFLSAYLEATGFNQEESPQIDRAITYIIGLEFNPKVTGKITLLKVSLPDVKEALSITIWNKESSTVIKTAQVEVTSADTEFIADIEDLELIKDVTYAITMETNDYYVRKRTDEAEVVYPILVGNIQIDAYKWRGASLDPQYPTQLAQSYYSGDLSFDFIQTE